MGVQKSVGINHFPQQGSWLGHKVKVCFRYDTSNLINGTIIRQDIVEPGLTLIELEDGRIILDSECQYSLCKEEVMYDNYIVIKREDLSALTCDPQIFTKVNQILENYKKKKGDKPNQYLVVNKDEPYAKIVQALIELFEKADGTKYTELSPIQDRVDSILVELTDIIEALVDLKKYNESTSTSYGSIKELLRLTTNSLTLQLNNLIIDSLK